LIEAVFFMQCVSVRSKSSGNLYKDAAMVFVRGPHASADAADTQSESDGLRAWNARGSAREETARQLVLIDLE
jgi:hypothetical protein